MSDTITAALLIIGDEILSGRTEDKNINYLAKFLGELGIPLTEVRIVSDEFDAIIPAVNDLRSRFTYLFTTGGIGPTHDDITAEAIAKAFDVPLNQHPEAYQILADYYGEEKFSDARKRMTRVPEGGTLIKNPVSLAPGFQTDNVFTLAGVPKIMQAMLEDVRPRLKTGNIVHSQELTLDTGESFIANFLTELQAKLPDVSIGSYPFYGEGRYGVQIVFRSIDSDAINQGISDLTSYCTAEDIPIKS